MTEYLNVDTIHDLHQTAVEVGLDAPGNRPLLFAGINRQFVAQLPRADNSSAQVLLDLLQMQNATLIGGEVPLVTWLDNAVRILGARVERQQFQDALQTAAGTREKERPRDHPPGGQEKIVQGFDLLPQGFLVGAMQVSASVARLTVRRYEQGVAQNLPGTQDPMAYWGTGWVLAPDLVVTNHHVVNARSESEQAAGPADMDLQARNTVVEFGYDSEGVATVTAAVSALAAADQPLDYAVLQLGQPMDRPPLRLAPTDVIESVGTNQRPVNIVQHAGGKPKALGIRNNLVASYDADDLRYFTDTMPGASGSPVCDDDWKVVALHKAWTYIEDVNFQGKPTAWVNRGTRIDRIAQHLQEHSPAVWAKVAAG